MGVAGSCAASQAGRPDRRGRAAPGRGRPGPALARRRASCRRSSTRRCSTTEVPGLEPRGDRRAARPGRPGGDLRRAVVRRRAGRRGARGPRDGPAARSSRCCRTAAGNTCPPARTTGRSTRSRTSSRAASAGGERATTRRRRAPGPAPARLRRDSRGDRRARPGASDPNEACGIVIGDRPAAERRARAALRCRRATGRLAVSLRDRSGRPAPADDRDRRRRRGVLGDRPLPRPHRPRGPRPTDIGLAFYPDALYLLVSLAASRRIRTPASRASGLADRGRADL